MNRSIIQCVLLIYNQYTVRSYICLIIFVLQFSVVAGQTITGRISSEKDKGPLPGVTVIADDTVAVIADSTGNYILNLSAGLHMIEFRMISFKSDKRNITLEVNERKELNVTLLENARELGIVVVSAGRFEQNLEDVTVSMEVLKSGLIEKRNSITMDEAVDNVPGVNVIDGQANIRGGSGWSYGAGSRVQILVDDLPQLTADASDAKWNFIPVENLEQVEVIKGASSVLFGSSALNGVINIRTAYPRDTPLTKINIYFGIYDDAFITTDKKYSLQYQDKQSFYKGLNFFHSRKINKLDFVVGGNHLEDNGYRLGENEKRSRLNINTRYRFKLPGLAAGVNFNTMINDATIFFLWKNDTSGAYRPALNTLSDSKTYRTNIDPYVTYSTAGGSTHKIRTRWFNSTNVNNTDQNSRGDLYYSDYQYQKHFNESVTITTGMVNIYSKVVSQLYGDHDGNQKAAYFQGDVRWKRFAISGGGRAEQIRVDDRKEKWIPVFRSGINFHPFGETYLRVSYGEGYRFPSIAERYIKTSVSGVNIFPNPDIDSERGLSREIGIKQGFKIGNWYGYVDMAAFENRYYNMIEFVFAQWATTPDIFQNLGFKSVNVGNTRIRGLEFTMAVEGKLANEFVVTLQGGYTYIVPRQITFDSSYVMKIGPDNVLGSDNTDFLKYRYRHMTRADMEIKRKRFSIGLGLRYTSRMENIDRIFVSGLLDFAFSPGLGIGDYRNYNRNGDYIFDFRTAYDITKFFKLALIIKNFSNHIYMQRPADMQPPRTFALMAGFKF